MQRRTSGEEVVDLRVEGTIIIITAVTVEEVSTVEATIAEEGGGGDEPVEGYRLGWQSCDSILWL